jgi:hypothetical protein
MCAVSSIIDASVNIDILDFVMPVLLPCLLLAAGAGAACAAILWECGVHQAASVMQR